MCFDDDSGEESFDESDEVQVFGDNESSATGSAVLICSSISGLPSIACNTKPFLLLEYSASAGAIAGSPSDTSTKKNM